MVSSGLAPSASMARCSTCHLALLFPLASLPQITWKRPSISSPASSCSARCWGLEVAMPTLAPALISACSTSLIPGNTRHSFTPMGSYRALKSRVACSAVSRSKP